MQQCPKCNYQRQPQDANVHAGICPKCGIAYQKWLDRHVAQSVKEQDADDAPHEDGDADAASRSSRLFALLMEVPERTDSLAFGARVMLLIGFVWWTIHFARSGMSWEIIGGSFLHNINLPFHEFGHVFFSPFGDFMMILGGSLFQVLMPLGLLAVFVLQQRDNFAAALMLWWSGQNLVDLSPYIRDAEYRMLPLVGGHGEESHDWGNLLERWGDVGNCYRMAHESFVLGIAVMLLGLLWATVLLYRQWQNLKNLHEVS